MIVLSLGLPGAFAGLCDALLINLARHATSDVEFIALNSLDEIALHMFQFKSAQLVVGSRQPTARFRSALGRNQVDFILALDEPRAAIGKLVLDLNYDLVTATRAVASSFANLLPCLRFPGAIVFSPLQDFPLFSSVAKRLNKYFGLTIPDEEFKKFNDLEDELKDSRLQLETWWLELDMKDRALVTGAVDGYRSCMELLAPLTFRWDQRLFFWGDDPNYTMSGPKDISGAARCLFYGPFANVPSGHWTITVVLGCSSEVAGTEFLVEVFAGRRLCHGIWQPHQAGTYEANFDVHISEDDETADHPLQIRVFNQQPVLMGRLNLASATMTSMEF